MPRQSAPIQVNQFVGGLNTEANLINYPPNSSFDEVNLELESNGTRVQRFGFDMETGAVPLDTTIGVQAGLHMGRSQFRWFNPSGYNEEQIIVVQIGNYLGFHKVTDGTITNNRIYTDVLDTALYDRTFSYAVVDGYLIVVAGLRDVLIYEFDGDVTVTRSLSRILIRDFFGCEFTDGTPITYTDYSNLSKRPGALNRYGVYNLRNQTFAVPQVEHLANTVAKVDPLAAFYTASGSTVWPSNADNLNEHLWADTTKTTSRTVDRYQATDHFAKSPQNERAPMGYFIIDAVDRGASRQAALLKLEADFPDLTVTASIVDFPADRTPGGPNVVAGYAGRVWYAGFSSDVIDGDEESPRLGSYVFFSQIVQDKATLTHCYQKADPTNPKDPDLAQDDGGFLKIESAYNIKYMLHLQNALYVFAENGVWRISGTEENTFTATGYSIDKVSEFGCMNGNSIVEYGGQVFYWGKDGIYRLFQDPTLNTYQVENISEGTVQSIFDAFGSVTRKTVVGYYDERTTSVRWLYGADPSVSEGVGELILNLRFQAFTKNFIDSYTSTLIGPSSVCSGDAVIDDSDLPVTAGGVAITANSAAVTVPNPNPILSPSEFFYCIITKVTSGTIRYLFGGYQEGEYNDYTLLQPGSTFFPECYLVTGPVNTGEGRLRKDINYLTVHMPYEASGLSCMYTARWGWNNDINSGRWSVSRDAYRTNSHSSYLDVVSTRNKVRGYGRAVAFKFETDGTSPLKIFGWEFTLNAREKE